MGTDISGVADIMQTQQVKMQKKIEEYIQNQLRENFEYDQMTIKEYIDPFTGEPVKKKIRKAQGAFQKNDVAAGELFDESLDLVPVTGPYRASTNHQLIRWS